MTEPELIRLIAACAGTAVVTALVVGLAALSGQRRQREALDQLRSERDATAGRLGDSVARVEDLGQELAVSKEREREQALANVSLQIQLEERERSLREQLANFEAAKNQLKLEFESLSQKVLDQRDKQLRDANQTNISAVLKPLEKQIEGFQTHVGRLHKDFLQNSASLEQQIRSLETVGLAMSGEASNLTRALKGDKKLVGNWGEAQLERTLQLAGLQPGEHYETQVSYPVDGGRRLVPDAVVKLPDGKNLVIDSKVSLVDYERAIVAETDAERETALAAHTQAVKNHIDQLASKDYASLPGMASPDFVLMFMPVEPAYIEVMRSSRDLFNHGYRKNVVMVSHSTLMPILRTVSNLWRLERSSAEARAISERAGEVYNAVSTVAERLESLGKSLQAAGNHYNSTVTALVGRQGLHARVEQFRALSNRTIKAFPEGLDTIPEDNDVGRLSSLAGAASEAEDPDPSADA